ncbi:MAG: site-2 protease family protein [Phycisphaerales bacterium]|nr:site-2 protease family protein [Phycisphaerales bacterium]
MSSLLSFLGSAGDLLLVILGFGFIVFLHELGHFLAARWAGIRVLSFALGFGPAMVSFRKGLGWRRGGSEREYLAILNAQAAGVTTIEGAGPLPAAVGISPTEYRLNWLPFGGYVRMLGQDDLNPGAVSAARDSYQSTPVWKRMIVISAGVIANIVSAAIMFVMVFMIGLKTEPAKIGDVQPGSPAAITYPINGDRAGITDPGLKPGDVVLAVNGQKPNSFNDLVLATAMARRGDAVGLSIHRSGIATPLEFDLTPRQSTVTNLLDIGIGPALSGSLPQARNELEERLGTDTLTKLGLPGVKPGMALVRIGAQTDVRSAHDLDEAVRASRGSPIEVEFASPAGERVIAKIPTRAELQTDLVVRSDESVVPVRHIVGLTPVMGIREAQEIAKEQGLRDGDIFARLGAIEYPSIAQGMQEIKRNAGKKVPIVVLRRKGSEWIEIPLEAKVSGKGTIGFFVGESDADTALLAVPPEQLRPAVQIGSAKPEMFRPPAVGIIDHPGSRITAVNGIPVETLTQVRDLLRTAAISALAETQRGVTARLTIEPPRAAGQPGQARPTSEVDLTLKESELRALASLTWTSPVGSWIFEPEQMVLKATGPLAALDLGLAETRRVMMTTYLTFARLFQGTVKVEHLKGPVGIAHIGTRLADRGLVWLLFFMALISVNLAVINFLPLPIVDGGQFIFLTLEGIRGRPVPIPIQNAVSLAGIALIGSVFLIVTFNDIRNLFGP